MVYVEGRIQTRSWEDQGGAKHFRTEIIADNMIMLDSKGSLTPKESVSPKEKDEPSEEEVNVEEIPF